MINVVLAREALSPARAVVKFSFLVISHFLSLATLLLGVTDGAARGTRSAYIQHGCTFRTALRILDD